MAYGVAYLVTNRVNGKPYVGQTTIGLDTRWATHVSRARTRPRATALGRAIVKYGAEAFDVERLVSVDDAPALDAVERFWIGVCRSQAPHGYNLTDGGASGSVQSQASRARNAASLRRRYEDPAFLRRHVEILASLRSDPDVQRRRGDGIRRAWSDPVVRARHMAAREPMRKPIAIVHLASGERLSFSGQREAARSLGISFSSLRSIVTGTNYQTHGYACEVS